MREGVYCSTDGETRIFAGKHTAAGELLFGVSVWDKKGRNLSVYGLAAPSASGWHYLRMEQQAGAEERCALDIKPGISGEIDVEIDRHASCREEGGVGVAVRGLQFGSDTYEGPVGNKLDDAEAFQKAGRCAGGRDL